MYFTRQNTLLPTNNPSQVYKTSLEPAKHIKSGWTYLFMYRLDLFIYGSDIFRILRLKLRFGLQNCLQKNTILFPMSKDIDLTSKEPSKSSSTSIHLVFSVEFVLFIMFSTSRLYKQNFVKVTEI